MRPVSFIYRNAKAFHPNASHIGLGVNCSHAVNVLRRNKIETTAHSALEIDDTIRILESIPSDSIVVIEAIWLITENVKKLLNQFPKMEFIIRSHSNIGFIQVEPPAINLFKEQLKLSELNNRLIMAGNNQRFCDFCKYALNQKCNYLPNLYNAERVSPKPGGAHTHRLMRVGSFGALRLLKMHIVSAAAALMAARMRGCDLEFHMTTGRIEAGGNSVLDAIRNLFAGLPWAKLVEEQWADWPTFRHLVSHMDITVQLSASESFNLVTADSLAEGTPAVVSTAIDWVPESWQVDVDDVDAAAQKIIHILADPKASQRGIDALNSYCTNSLDTWTKFLNNLN